MARMMKLALAIMTAALLPAWGQAPGSVVWKTIPNLAWGLDRGGTVSTTTFTVINRDSVIHTIELTITDSSGNEIPAMVTDDAGNPPEQTVLMGMHNIPPFSAIRLVISPMTSDAPAIPMEINLGAIVGDDGLPVVVGDGRVAIIGQGITARRPVTVGSPPPRFLRIPRTNTTDDATKVIKLLDLADPSTVTAKPGTVFAVPAFLATVGTDTVLTLSNPGDTVANVMLVARPPAILTPADALPTFHVAVQPGTQVMQTLSQAFPDIVPSLCAALVVATSDQVITLSATALAVNSDGSTVAAPASVFTLTSAPPPQPEQ